ncbi:MAG TPA: N-acetylmuramoyl-L-alanine amidase [Candidatus Moranbacteria bacterium]|nr:N-acetylmuramoyl-L-alanine amidase [Candidatus Moranbacteria bacterium]HSA07926.1 N-acetylmuramoyl-L-alanine amidase [Candidatus Moranbacteria bacterium]
MDKKKIIIISFIVLFVAVFSGCAFFSEKKTVSIVNSEQGSVNNEQETVDNSQQAEYSSQQKVDSIQNPADKEQQAADSEQDAVNSDQEKEDTETNDEQSEIKNTAKIIERFVSWGFEKSSGRKIDTIIVHSSYDALGSEPFSVSGLLNEYKQYGVATHYLIDREGKIYQLVADKNIAYHAGESKVPDGRTGVNAFSIGIEMMNTEDGKFTSEQYSALNSLIVTLKNRYSIKYILGHKDIAPGRKTDPWNINWTNVQK